MIIGHGILNRGLGLLQYMLQLLEGLSLLGLGVALGHDFKLLSVKLVVHQDPLFANLGINFNLIVHLLAETLDRRGLSFLLDFFYVDPFLLNFGSRGLLLFGDPEVAYLRLLGSVRLCKLGDRFFGNRLKRFQLA